MLIQYQIRFTDNGVTISQFVDPDAIPGGGPAPSPTGAVGAKRLGSSFQDSGGGGNLPTGPGSGGNLPTGPGSGGNLPTGPGSGGGSISSTGPIKAILLGPLIVTAPGGGAGAGGGGNLPTGPGSGGNLPTGPGSGGRGTPASAAKAAAKAAPDTKVAARKRGPAPKRPRKA